MKRKTSVQGDEFPILFWEKGKPLWVNLLTVVVMAAGLGVFAAMMVLLSTLK